MLSKKARKWKEKKFSEISQMRKTHSDFIFFDFTGLNVPAFINLRKKMKESGNEVRVSKNTFVEKLFGIRFKVPIAVVGVKDDPIKAVKDLLGVVDEKKIVGSLVGGTFYSGSQTVGFKSLPSTSEIKAILVGNLYNILHKLALSLKWYPAMLVSILKQKSEQAR